MQHDHISLWLLMFPQLSIHLYKLVSNFLQLHVKHRLAGRLHINMWSCTFKDMFLNLIKFLLHCSCAFSKTNNRIQSTPDLYICFCISLTFATFITMSWVEKREAAGKTVCMCELTFSWMFLCVYLTVEASKYFLCRPINVRHVKCGQTSVYVGLHGLNWKDKRETLLLLTI